MRLTGALEGGGRQVAVGRGAPVLMLAEPIFWTAAAVVLYVYAGYPLLVWALARIFGRPVRKGAIFPSVSLLVPAYNEAGTISAKIRNSLALNYPAGKLEIVIASDGSSDGTAEIASRLADGRRVRVMAYPRNRGKLAVLNECVPALGGEIVAFSDASSMLEPDALQQLVRSFADPSVGAASGLYRLRKADSAYSGAPESFYWKYETFLKSQEAALGSVLGAHGALYAIRKQLYPELPPGSINDDYLIPLRIMRQGYRVAYEPAAVACEEALEMEGFSRRVRIMAGNIRQLREIPPLLKPPRPLALFCFLSHKAGRLVSPAGLLAALLSSLWLSASPAYAALAALQAAFYLVAILGAFVRLRPRLLRLPFYFCMINAAAVAGLVRVLGRRSVAWK